MTAGIPPKLPIGVTSPVTINCDRDELARIVCQGLMSYAPMQFLNAANHEASNELANAVVAVLLSGKSSAQLAHEATNGQEGGER